MLVQFPGTTRGVEDLKARYYGLARALVIGRGGATDLIANEWLVKHPFDAERETCALLRHLFVIIIIIITDDHHIALFPSLLNQRTNQSIIQSTDHSTNRSSDIIANEWLFKHPFDAERELYAFRLLPFVAER